MLNTHFSKLEFLRREVQQVKDVLLTGVAPGYFQDVAFVGNASGLYPWEPSLIIDLDVCVFAHQRDLGVGMFLWELRRRLGIEMSAKGVDFDLRIIRGSYKRALVSIQRPALVAHVSLVTEELYLQRPMLLRWAWRKYPCMVELGRLGRLAPAERPTVHELLHGRGGVAQRLKCVESGSAPLVEWTLPDLTEVESTIRSGDPLFAEYCLAAGATCARNHARVLGRPEADYLGNREFVSWYDRSVLPSAALRQLMDLKQRVRMEGYGEALSAAQELARTYLAELYGCIIRASV